MSTIVDCPSCERKLRVPDELLGEKVKCPTCGGTFDAVRPSSAPAPAPASQPAPAFEATSSPGEPAAADSEPSLAPAVDAPPPEPPAPAKRPWRLPVRESDLIPCPYCGERIHKNAARCRYCDEYLDEEEDEDDDRPWERGRARRDCEPHRGSSVLILGIISLVLGVTWLLALVGLGLGIAAWVMGHRDLRKIRERVMDPEGQGSTQAGWICGIIGTFLCGLGTLGCVAYIAMIAAFAQAMKPAPAPAPAPPVRQQPQLKTEALPQHWQDYLPA